MSESTADRTSISFILDLEEGEGFDGPLDLLLFLVKKNELDIHDLPVSLITAQYLEYITYMEQVNLSIAGDFLVMAATLTQIKSRMLLPGEDPDGGEEPEDPRLAIVTPLLEYARVQEAAEALSSRYVLDRDVFVRGLLEDFTDPSDHDGGPLIKTSLYDLVEAWRSLASRPARDGSGLDFRLETATIQERLQEVRGILIARGRARFSELCTLYGGGAEASLSLLAVLELAKTGFLKLWQETDTEGALPGPDLFLADKDASSVLEFDYK
jgi:segregation and condensation protein A